MTKKILFSVLLFPLLFPSPAFGATSSIPMGILVSQFVNVSLLIALIYFSQRKKVVQMLKDKKENFLKSVKDSAESKKQAQSVLTEVTKKFNEMSETFDEKTEEALKNAENSYQDQVRESRTQALRLKEMVQKNFEFEIQKQVENLRKETFEKSAHLAEKEMKKNLSVEKLRAWNAHFIKELN